VEDFVAIARIIRSRGNRGEMLAESLSSRPDRFEKVQKAWLDQRGRRVETELDKAWWHEDRLVLKFKGIDSINDAEAWRDAEVLVPVSERVALDEGEYFQSDLIGCVVVDRDQQVGTVRAIEETGGTDLLVVKSENGGREVLIPFTRAICRKVDVEARRIDAELPEGLLDLE
jgi:16S rRNA processing protein RimM